MQFENRMKLPQNAWMHDNDSLKKKAQTARFTWARFQNIQPKFRQGIRFNRNVEIITDNNIVVNSLYYKELRTLGLKINCSLPKRLKKYI